MLSWLCAHIFVNYECECSCCPNTHRRGLEAGADCEILLSGTCNLSLKRRLTVYCFCVNRWVCLVWIKIKLYLHRHPPYHSEFVFLEVLRWAVSRNSVPVIFQTRWECQCKTAGMASQRDTRKKTLQAILSLDGCSVIILYAPSTGSSKLSEPYWGRENEICWMCLKIGSQPLQSRLSTKTQTPW